MTPAPTIALFAKYPRAGHVKTRLAPLLGENGAAQLHRRLVERTVATLRESGLPFTVHYSGACAADFSDWLGDDVPLEEQGGGDLGERLAQVEAPGIVLGADIPGLSVRHLHDAVKALEVLPVAIGPASDGGYYLLGFTQAIPQLWQDISWGSDTVLQETRDRLDSLKIPHAFLDELDDCDRPEDLAQWPWLMP